MRNDGKSASKVGLFGLWRGHVFKNLVGVHTGVHKMLFLRFLRSSEDLKFSALYHQIKKAALATLF
jgi:hypothetical protein